MTLAAEVSKHPNTKRKKKRKTQNVCFRKGASRNAIELSLVNKEVKCVK